MPFPGPEMALRATIECPGREEVIPSKIVRPGVSWRVLRIINHLHQDSTTYGEFGGSELEWPTRNAQVPFSFAQGRLSRQETPLRNDEALKAES